MKPIQFIHYRETVWYNLADYVQLLTDANLLHRTRLPSRGRRHPLAKTPLQTLLLRLAHLSPVYQLQVHQQLYVDWVVFEHFYRSLIPFLIHPADSRNPGSLFRRIHFQIDHPSQLSTSMAAYFSEALVDLGSQENSSNM